MPLRKSIGLILFAMLYLEILTGCIAFYSYRPVTVSVHDAETGKPIAHARVSVGYPSIYLLNPPRVSPAETGQDGTATLRAPTLNPLRWNITADGYLGDELSTGHPTPQESQFRLYREPQPHITIVVHNDYRGLLIIEKRLATGPIQEQIGKREFTFAASADGFVRIEATPLLLRRDTFIVSARDQDGRTIIDSRYMHTPNDIVLRWVVGDMVNGTSRDLFVIGTEADEKDARSLVYDRITREPNSITFNRQKFNALFER